MHVRQGEVVSKIVRRHLTPFFFLVITASILSLPIFLVIYLIDRATDSEWIFTLYAIASFLMGCTIAIIAIDYLLDKLIITNIRVVFVDWRSLLLREENEIDLMEIQDIKTKVKGILSEFAIFDYGTCSIETAASKTSIVFYDCPNPEGIKHFILNQISSEHSKK